MWEQVQETVNYINDKIGFTPEYGVILGSGLGSFTDDIEIEYILNYSEIPNFPVSTVQGHKGALVFGTIGGKKVKILSNNLFLVCNPSAKKSHKAQAVPVNELVKAQKEKLTIKNKILALS